MKLKDLLFVEDFHGLKFADIKGLIVSKKSLPDGRFYGILYKSLNLKYGGKAFWSDAFFNNKLATADLLLSSARKVLGANERAGRWLSIGAGLGITESKLHDTYDIDIVATEFYKHSETWSPSVSYFKSIDDLPG